MGTKWPTEEPLGWNASLTNGDLAESVADLEREIWLPLNRSSGAGVRPARRSPWCRRR
jgi:hypothetical protein